MRQDTILRRQAMLDYDTGLRTVHGVICGVDEAGRGPLAGDVFAAAVVFSPDNIPEGLNDSKKLSEKKRESLFDALREAADYCKSCFVWPDVIDEINILNATKRAMEECGADFSGTFLIDAVTGLRLPGELHPLIHGDAISYMIGAASIIAKVERDRYMIEMDAKYPMYGFARNKGYGTAEHIAALKEYGPCPIHRRSFIGGILGEKK